MDKIKINKNLRWLVMPDFVYSDPNLTDTSRRVYCFIHSFKGDHFFFGNEHLAEMFNCSDDSISRAISLLIELKYISCEYEQKAGGGRLRFIQDLGFQHRKNPKLKTAKTPSGDEGVNTAKTPSGDEANLKLRNDNNINDNNNKQIFLNKEKDTETPPTTNDSSLNSDFEDWKNSKRAAKARKLKSHWSRPTLPSDSKFPEKPKRKNLDFTDTV